jgi:hypothetical protein
MAKSELTGERLQELLGLLAGVDSVELKLTLQQDARAQATGRLGVDPLDGQIRQVFFFDTPNLDLNQGGVVVRARRRQREDGDTVIKIRPVVPDELPEEERSSPSLGVELDAMPGGYVCSASFKGVADNEMIRQVARGETPLRKLFSKDQRRFFETHAPDGIALDDLKVLGPIPTLRIKFQPDGFPRKAVGELWLYPDGSQIVELSSKSLPKEAVMSALEWRAYLESKGIDLSGEQATKTATALEFFVSKLA